MKLFDTKKFLLSLLFCFYIFFLLVIVFKVFELIFPFVKLIKSSKSFTVL